MHVMWLEFLQIRGLSGLMKKIQLEWSSWKLRGRKELTSSWRKPERWEQSTLENIRKRIQFKSLTLTYKCLNNQAPTYLSDLLVPRQSSYNTRSSQHLLLHVPRTYKSVGDRAFSLCAPKFWNNLPHYLQQCQSLNTFKKSLKSHLF